MMKYELKTQMNFLKNVSLAGGDLTWHEFKPLGIQQFLRWFWRSARCVRCRHNCVCIFAPRIHKAGDAGGRQAGPAEPQNGTMCQNDVDRFCWFHPFVSMFTYFQIFLVCFYLSKVLFSNHIMRCLQALVLRLISRRLQIASHWADEGGIQSWGLSGRGVLWSGCRYRQIPCVGCCNQDLVVKEVHSSLGAVGICWDMLGYVGLCWHMLGCYVGPPFYHQYWLLSRFPVWETTARFVPVLRNISSACVRLRPTVVRIMRLVGAWCQWTVALKMALIKELQKRERTLWLCQNSYWKWPVIGDLPIENGDFP